MCHKKARACKLGSEDHGLGSRLRSPPLQQRVLGAEGWLRAEGHWPTVCTSSVSGRWGGDTPYQLPLPWTHTPGEPPPTLTLGLVFGATANNPETWVQAWGGGASPTPAALQGSKTTTGRPPSLLRVRPRGAQTCHLHWSPIPASPTMAPTGSEATPGQAALARLPADFRDQLASSIQSEESSRWSTEPWDFRLPFPSC